MLRLHGWPDNCTPGCAVIWNGAVPDLKKLHDRVPGLNSYAVHQLELVQKLVHSSGCDAIVGWREM